MRKGDYVKFTYASGWDKLITENVGVLVDERRSGCWLICVENGFSYIAPESDITPLGINVFTMIKEKNGEEMEKAELIAINIQNAFAQFDKALIALRGTTTALRHTINQKV